MKKRSWMNLPNFLTSVRILLAPALLLAALGSSYERQWPSLLIFLAAGLTDCLDGYFARRLNQITPLGKLLDPIADKLLTAAVLFCLARFKAVSWAALGVIAAKEIYMGWGAVRCLKRGIEVQADLYGKIATVLFYPAALLCWPWHAIVLIAEIGRGLIYLSLICSLAAAAHYTVASVKKWREMQARVEAD